MGLMEQIEQKPEYLILGAVGVGVVLFMATNRKQQSDLPKAAPATQVTTTPATDTVSLGTVQQLINDYQQNEQNWILQQLEHYYQQYNGQPPNYAPPIQPLPSPDPRIPVPHCGNPGEPPCVTPGRGGDTEAFYRWPNTTAIGGDSPRSPETFTGRRWETHGIRSLAGGF